MYAAAGGASLASRQARQRQRQQKTKALKNKDLTPKPPQTKQFHNYTDNEPTTTTTIVAPRLSRVERGVLNLKPPISQHHHHHHHHAPNERRHSTSNYLNKDHQQHTKTRIRESPSICIPIQPSSLHHHHHHASSTHHIPQHLPLSPTTLVHQQQHEHHHHPHHPQSNNNLDGSSTFSLPQNQLPQIFLPEDDGRLERRCSFVRQVEEVGKKEDDVLDRCNHICNFEIKDSQYYFDEKDLYGSWDYPFSECSQGRAAWQERERGRRCSLSEEARLHRIKQTEAHHRWMKRNRIHDATYGGGSDDDDDFVAFHQSAAANALLYVGLGTIAMGSVIFFVGTGDKGFKTLELRLIGPTLMVVGLLCCILRVLLCACPTSCFKGRKKIPKKSSLSNRNNNNRRRISDQYPEGMDQVDFVPADKTALLHKHTRKKVSIVPPNYSLPSTSTSEFKELPSLNLENELRKLSIPQIHLPSVHDSEEQQNGLSHEGSSIMELETYDDIQSVSSNGSEEFTVIEEGEEAAGLSSYGAEAIKLNKLTRNRQPAMKSDNFSGDHQIIMDEASGIDDDHRETATTALISSETLSVVIERGDDSDSLSECKKHEKDFSKKFKKIVKKAPNNTNSNNNSDNNKHSGILLSPLDLGQ